MARWLLLLITAMRVAADCPMTFRDLERGLPGGSSYWIYNPTVVAATGHAYHGLARVLIRSSEDHATSPEHRRFLRSIDMESGAAPSTATIADPQQPDSKSQSQRSDLDPIVVKASAPGLGEATISIPVSADLADLPHAVAARSM